MNDDSFFSDVEQHLEDAQFRRQVILFQRCDNVLRPLLDNLEQMEPRAAEEIAIYRAFLDGARRLLEEMAPLLPEGTYSRLNARLDQHRRQLPDADEPGRGEG